MLDNSPTHKTPSIQRGLLRHPRFHLHFTPTYSTWLNLAERWFAISSRRSAPGFEGWNDDPKPYVWHKTADEILDSLAAYSQRINESGHYIASSREVSSGAGRHILVAALPTPSE